MFDLARHFAFCGGEYVAGETRFAGSVEVRVGHAAIDIIDRELNMFAGIEHTGGVLTDEQRATREQLMRELDKLAGKKAAAELAP